MKHFILPAILAALLFLVPSAASAQYVYQGAYRPSNAPPPSYTFKSLKKLQIASITVGLIGVVAGGVGTGLIVADAMELREDGLWQPLSGECIAGIVCLVAGVSFTFGSIVVYNRAQKRELKIKASFNGGQLLYCF